MLTDKKNRVNNNPSNFSGSQKVTPAAIDTSPQWRKYLAERRILEAAIAAEAWIEHESFTGHAVLVWKTRRRDGSPGTTRRRLIKPVKVNGKKQAKVRWQFGGTKTDEPVYYVGTLEELKREIARACGTLYIVEGEFDVWSLKMMGIHNVIGIYGISNIPKDIAEILTELAVASFVYFADNDKAGETGASNLRALLHGSDWTGEGEYRRFAGPGIPEKGDANDLLCSHYPDIKAVRAALDALPPFQPRLKRKKAAKRADATHDNEEGWGAVKQEIRIELGVEPADFNRKGYSPNFRCRHPDHDHDDAPSAAWHEDGYYKCFACGVYNARETADFLNIDWRALLWPQSEPFYSKTIDLNAAPDQDAAARAPLTLDKAPDSWLRLAVKFLTPTEAVLLHFALPLCTTGPLAQGFTRDEFIQAARPLGCDLKADTIKNCFKEHVYNDDKNPIFGKVDPGDPSSITKCKFRLRPPADIQRRLLHRISYRVYERKFRQHDEVLIGFKAFEEALVGSTFPIQLESALAPLYREQKQAFRRLVRFCEGLIAEYEADLEDLSVTPLPDWKIEKPCELKALLARALYDEDPRDRSKSEWARDIGISKANVHDTLTRASIRRDAYIIEEEVSSQREAKELAREHQAKIMGVEIDGKLRYYDAAMPIADSSRLFLQPPSAHTVVSDEKQVVKAAPPNPSAVRTEESKMPQANNMAKPGNWTKSSWDPQFIYWELVKACCLLHGYEVIDDVGLRDPATGEVWTNPTRDELIALIIGESAEAEPQSA